MRTAKFLRHATPSVFLFFFSSAAFGYGSASDPLNQSGIPAATRIDHSKFIGFVMTDKKGNPICGGTPKGTVAGLPACTSTQLALVQAGLPKGVSVETKTAFLPALLVGIGAAACFTGGAVVAISVMQKLQGDPNAKVMDSLGHMNDGLVPIFVGKIITPWIAGNLSWGLAETAISWSVSVCGVSAVAGAGTAAVVGEVVYYAFARQKSDFGHAH